MLQCVAVCCSVLQCVAVCCSVYTRYLYLPSRKMEARDKSGIEGRDKSGIEGRDKSGIEGRDMTCIHVVKMSF